jgi:hypothetical protein
MTHKFVFSLPVWGKVYIENFLVYSLPSLLATNNLVYLKETKSILEYYIYTRAEDKALFRASTSFHTLSNIVNVHFVEIDDALENDKYNVMTYAHMDTMVNRSDINDYMCLMVSDAIYSDGFFRYIYEQILQKKKIVYMLGFRTNPLFAYQCVERYWDSITSSMSIDSTMLSQLAMEHMHASSASHIVSRKAFTSWPSVLIEKCSSGMIMKGFHLHPIIVQSTRTTKNTESFYSIDGSELNLIKHLDECEIGYIDDSQKASMYTFELDEQRTRFTVEDRMYNAFALASWMRHHAGENHLRLVEHDFIVNAHDAHDISVKMQKMKQKVDFAKTLLDKGIIFDDFIALQQAYLRGDIDLSRKMILQMLHRLNEYLRLKTHLLQKYESKLKDILVFMKNFEDIDTFFDIVNTLGNTLNELGRGESYFSILKENQVFIRTIKQLPDNVVLYGLGDFGKEVYFLLAYYGKSVAFIIDDGVLVDEYKGTKVVKFVKLENPKILNNYHVILCFRDIDVKKRLQKHLEKQGIQTYEIPQY